MPFKVVIEQTSLDIVVVQISNAEHRAVNVLVYGGSPRPWTCDAMGNNEHPVHASPECHNHQKISAPPKDLLKR